MNGCIFCKIAEGGIPSYKVWEDQANLAFLDINPIKMGHTLVVPKQHAGYFFNLEDEQLHSLIKAAKTVSQLLQETFQPRSGKVGMIVYGLDVDHVHVHLIPLDQPGDLSFANKKPASPAELQATLDQIKKIPHL